MKLKDTQAQESTSATFVCLTNDDELPVQWLVNDKPVTPSEKYKIQSDGFQHTFTISDLSPDDNCEVTVVIGDNSSSAKLTVEGRLLFCQHDVAKLYGHL